MTEIRPASSPLLSRARKLRTYFSAAFVLLGLAIFMFLKVGQWLVVEDPMQKSQAIVVLSGAMPFRALEAAKLYRMGYAPQVWLTRSEEPRASLAALGIPYQGEEDYNRMILEREGVPAASVVVLPAPIQNTGLFPFLGAPAGPPDTGAAGAPKTGDTAAWAPRIAQGYETLVKTALAGKGAMPPRGGASDLSDFEVERAIVYMADKSGANFPEPKAPEAAASAPAAAASAAK